MKRCHHCGGEVVFRKDATGKPYPIHLSGGCLQSGSSRTYDEPSDEQPCRRTRCPECRSLVWFVRHNGGSVWLEELGHPWPKHPCFDDADTGGMRALSRSVGTLPDERHRFTLLAVVGRNFTSQIQVEESSFHCSYIELTPLSSVPFAVRMMGDVGVRSGDLVCWTPNQDGKSGKILFSEAEASEGRIVPLRVFDKGVIQASEGALQKRFVRCPFCKTPVGAARLRSHFSRCPVRRNKPGSRSPSGKGK
jgi:hypothetical protein